MRVCTREQRSEFTARLFYLSLSRSLVQRMTLRALAAAPVQIYTRCLFRRATPRRSPLTWVQRAHSNFSILTLSSTTVLLCQSVDVRNSVKEFSKLQNCQVVEGFVQILLIDEANDTSFQNLEFPDLVEITGYLLLYRVQGLKSIGQLFPNLKVIRGHQLFTNYALVAFEMMSMQEIGLRSLTDIMRGSVRFEKNPMLCYADTVDWDNIAKAGKGENVIAMNMPMNECPVCDKDCPPRPTNPEEKLCWNKQTCQKVCPKACGDRACSPSGECCHPFCVGGCSGPLASDCQLCREVVVNQTQCIDSCPPGTYEFFNRRCVTQQECRMMRRPREINAKQYPYKPFGNQCLLECPRGYEEISENDMYSCKRCNGPCFKECPGTVVDNISTAQKLRGCSFINGSLEIAIRDGQNIVRELEESLGNIQVITGYLKIFRNFPLISLNFLKNLTEIRGDKLEMKEYSLVVLDNQNLQELWNFTSRPPLKIGSHKGLAKISFHYNPRLCLQNIEELRERTGLGSFTEIEVSSTSNGDKVACNITELKSVVYSVTSKAALIKWESFKHHDMRTLLSYVVYSKEAPNQNVSMYDSRDACGGDGWKVTDVAPQDEEKKNPLETAVDDGAGGFPYDVPHSNPINYHQSTILASLKPYTQYAYYVKTYTILTERSGAQSKLQYFTTLPGQPSAVRSLAIYSNSSDTLVINWLPPLNPNCNLTHYRIIGKLEPYDLNYLKQRNYCDEPMQAMERKSLAEIVAEEKLKAEKELEASQKMNETSECQCPCGESKPTISEQDVSSSIAFEDALHNQVYIKRGNSRRRRSLEDELTGLAGDAKQLWKKEQLAAGAILDYVVRDKREHNSYQEENHKDMIQNKKTLSKPSKKPVPPEPKDIKEGDSYVQFVREVPASSLTFVMRELRHFGKYTIHVMACREKDERNPEQHCSPVSLRSMQTLRKEQADDIPKGSFRLEKMPSNDSTTTVKLMWDEPPQPNGVILTYQIEYKRVDVLNHKAIVACITQDNFHDEGNQFILPSLSAGNYSVRIRASSFAGMGAYSETLYIDIPDSNLSAPFWQIFLIILSILCCIIVIGVAAAFTFRKKFMQSVPSMRLLATVNPEYTSAVYKLDEWEVPRKKIKMGKELGNGSFGMVYEGICQNLVKGQTETRCAIKTVNEGATDRERVDFLNEASVMKGFDTHHVVKLLGVVSQGHPVLVIMELMENGDLKSFLRNHRPDKCQDAAVQPVTRRMVYKMAIEIADGMAYLSAKKFVHRDLAARNCMVATDLTVKIGDFGMTRDIYETDYYRKGSRGLLPVRWMAPESLQDGVFSSFSDVWSYGVVVWEMCTLASQPYQGLSNEQVVRYVLEGGVMEQPDNVPDRVYALMRHCWRHKASNRPTFTEIVSILLDAIQPHEVEYFKTVSFYHTTEGIEAQNQNSQHTTQRNDDVSYTEFQLVTMEDLREGEEDDEQAPLRPFGDFTVFRPMYVKNGSNARYGIDGLEEVQRDPAMAIGVVDLDSSKAPLRAGFDDFDGVSAGSLASSKDTLNLPFVEDGVRSNRSVQLAQLKSSSKGNVSQGSLGRSSLSPQSPGIVSAPSNSGNRPSPSLASSGRSDADYVNHSPEVQDGLHPNTIQMNNLRVSFASLSAADAVEPPPSPPPTVRQQQPQSPVLTQEVNANAEETAKPLNSSNSTKTNELSEQQQQASLNGYAGGPTTT
uniref:Tyrosine-protein kinase receptor n=1 Tax=Trichogramma kaykai TaxID=54128 RepID=A0ABD2XMG2_9HYME